MKNPFNYLQFATGDDFYDRHEIRADLRSRFLSGQTNVVLYGPRRYGKSSLVAELMSDLEKGGLFCVSVDVMKTPSIDLFVSAYVSKIYKKFAPLKFEFKRIGELLKSLRFKMTIGADSFGIPNMRVVASESLMGGDYKFKDYYSAFSKDRYRIVDIREDMPASILESSRNGFEASQNEVARIQDSLVQSFPYNQKMV